MENEFSNIEDVIDNYRCPVCGAMAKVGLPRQEMRWDHVPNDDELKGMLIHCCGHVLTISDDEKAKYVQKWLVQHHLDQPTRNQRRS